MKTRQSVYFSWKKRKPTMAALNSLIRRLNDPQLLKGAQPQVTEAELIDLSYQVRDLLLDDPVCLDISLSTPLYIMGDLFGQFSDLIHMFHKLGFPEERRYLFLGNFIDRGRKSIETISLLFAYKLKYPNQIFLLRGNHECEYVSCHYGFLNECMRRYSRRLWRSMMNTFDCLPVCAIIEDSIFCVHGGLDPMFEISSVSNKIQLRDYITDQVRRPLTITNSTLLTNLVWSEPIPDASGWQPNPVGRGYWFGEDVIKQFCTRFNFTQIIRSGEMLENGYEFMADQKLLTIFTAPHLTNAFKNFGALVHLKKHVLEQQIHGRILIVKPNSLIREKKTTQSTIMIEDSVEAESSAIKDKYLREILSDVQSVEDLKTLTNNKRVTLMGP